MTQDLHRDVPEKLLSRRRVWERKRALRTLYRFWAELLRSWLPDDGPHLEVGTGSGTLAPWIGPMFHSDIQVAPWLDLVANVHHLPLRSGRLGGCVGVDIIHHLTDPHAFFDELTRVLRPGGRGVFIEPYITPLSRLIWSFHEEPICFDRYQEDPASDNPWQGNSAMANILFIRERADWPIRHPHLELLYLRPFSLFHVLAREYRSYSLAPAGLIAALIRSEWLLPRPLMSLLALRTLVVLQRSPIDAEPGSSDAPPVIPLNHYH